MNFDKVGWGEKLILFSGATYGIQTFLGTSYTVGFFVAALTLQYLTYLFGQPDLVVGDVDLLKQFLVKDFHIFTNRRDVAMNPEDTKSIFSHMLTLIRDDRWKNIRNTITPAFTAGKLKLMAPLIEKSETTLLEILEEKTNSEKVFDVKEVLGAFTMDVIAAVAFATDINSQREPENLFVKYANELQNFSFGNWRLFVAFLFAWTTKQLDKRLDYRLLFSDGEQFFKSSLEAIIRERRKQTNPNARQDFLQLLMNAAEADATAAEEEPRDHEISHDVGGVHVKLTEEEIIAQCFLFLIGGHGTTSTTLTFCAYSLATNPEKQEKCREEILEVAGTEGPIPWNAVQHKMPYLDATISETLRMYPPATRFDRDCSENYKLSDTIEIPKGAAVSVPVYVIHHSEEYYPNPEEFQPERFLHEEKARRNPLTWLPFGYGPRNCIGMRFAQYEMKLCLANMLRKFRLVPCGKTEVCLLFVKKLYPAVNQAVRKWVVHCKCTRILHTDTKPKAW